MQNLKSIMNWVAQIFDEWLTKVGQANRPIPHDFVHCEEESQIFPNSDRIGDEKGEFRS